MGHDNELKILSWNVQSRLEEDWGIKRIERIDNELSELAAVTKLAKESGLSKTSALLLILKRELKQGIETVKLEDIRNSSRMNRAEEIAKRIVAFEPDVVLLTEVKPGKSFGDRIINELKINYEVFVSSNNHRNTCAILLAVKKGSIVSVKPNDTNINGIENNVKFDLQERVLKIMIDLKTENKIENIEVLGIHIPPAPTDEAKIKRKEPYIKCCINYINEVEKSNSLSIIGGDFNPYYGHGKDGITDIFERLAEGKWKNCKPVVKGRNGIGNNTSKNQLDYFYISPD